MRSKIRQFLCNNHCNFRIHHMQNVCSIGLLQYLLQQKVIQQFQVYYYSRLYTVYHVTSLCYISIFLQFKMLQYFFHVKCYILTTIYLVYLCHFVTQLSFTSHFLRQQCFIPLFSRIMVTSVRACLISCRVNVFGSLVYNCIVFHPRSSPHHISTRFYMLVTIAHTVISMVNFCNTLY